MSIRSSIRQRMSISRKSAAIILVLVVFVCGNVILSRSVYYRVRAARVPSLVTLTPCALNAPATKSLNLTVSGNPVRGVKDSVPSSTCEYSRTAYNVLGELKLDQLWITVLEEGITPPTIFNQPENNSKIISWDRFIADNREIREVCGTATDCVVFIEPNVLVRAIYRSGGSPHEDIMTAARAFLAHKS